MSEQTQVDDSEWDESDPDVSRGLCDSCDEVRLVKVLADPYRAEVYDEHVTHHYCFECYGKRKDQI